MSKYFADATVIVEMLRGNEKAKRFLEILPQISIITIAELIQGCRDKNQLKIVEKKCNIFPQAKIDNKTSQLAIDLRKNIICLMDC